jgi:hypothetical protein
MTGYVISVVEEVIGWDSVANFTAHFDAEGNWFSFA